ncbi:MAG: VanZ family protein [Candidatus Limiplasma sp.]|nr:VanZ family protein [Candidatus Limiplasma sp.]
MDEVTAISLIVLAVALLLPVISELLAERRLLLRGLQYLIFAVYVFANLYETLLFRVVAPAPRYELGLFWSYREALSLHRHADGGLRLLITNSSLLKEILLNILLYIPLGYLLPFTWPSLAGKRQRALVPSGWLRRAFRLLAGIPWKVALIGMLASVLTEVTQLVFHLGLFEFDDILNNTLGCMIGLGMYWLLIGRR